MRPASAEIKKINKSSTSVSLNFMQALCILSLAQSSLDSDERCTSFTPPQHLPEIPPIPWAPCRESGISFTTCTLSAVKCLWPWWFVCCWFWRLSLISWDGSGNHPAPFFQLLHKILVKWFCKDQNLSKISLSPSVLEAKAASRSWR